MSRGNTIMNGLTDARLRGISPWPVLFGGHGKGAQPAVGQQLGRTSLGGAPVTGLSDRNFAGLEAKAYLDFKNVFMMHLPRLCEHCLNPACVASCPSGAMYKRDEDGIVQMVTSPVAAGGR